MSSAKAPLDYIVTYWDLFNPWVLRKEYLRFFYTQAWPAYKLVDGENGHSGVLILI